VVMKLLDLLPSGLCSISPPAASDRWCLWRPDQAGFDSRSIFDGALVEE
jgi:hypothetical protein